MRLRYQAKIQRRKLELSQVDFDHIKIQSVKLLEAKKNEV